MRTQQSSHFSIFRKLFKDGLSLVPLLMSLCKLSGEMSAEVSLPFSVQTFVNNVNKEQNEVPAINRGRASPQNTVLIPLPEKGILLLASRMLEFVK